ncbi:hypothetical protein HID58_005355 [Brassica napus]|uniref:Uncharacterized protein n=1 Tax=Brassica napus TaxID=3708 RepID=A0ABQ8E8B5_BRANA|nr:hypothetical protein HID58_005355 [Brassica napus]
MRSQRMSNIIVAGEFMEMFGAVESPQVWPSFLHQAGKIELGLSKIDGCQLLAVASEANKVATFIAKSVTKQGLVRSYV